MHEIYSWKRFKEKDKKNHEIAKNLGCKDISMSLEKDFSHVVYLVQCAGNIFFSNIRELAYRKFSNLVMENLKKKEESQLGAIARVTLIVNEMY